LMFKFSFEEGLTLLNGNSAVGDDFLQSRWLFLIPTLSTPLSPFNGSAINSGVFSPWYNASLVIDRNFEVSHTNGYYYFQAGNVNNSGYRIKDGGDHMKNPYKGTTYVALLSPLELTDTITRIGIFPTGVFTANVEDLARNCGFIINNGNVVARTSSNSNFVSTTSSPVTLTYGQWYYFFFEILDWPGPGAGNYSTVRFVIKDINNNVLMNVTHYTCWEGSGQQGVGLVSTRNTAATNKAILGISYVGFGAKKPNFLNDF